MSAVPARKTVTSPEPKVRLVKKKGMSLASIVMIRIVTFCMIAFAAYLISQLIFSIKIEEARTSLRVNSSKATMLNQASRDLRHDVESLRDFSAVQRWAVSNGFRSPDQIAYQQAKNE